MYPQQPKQLIYQNTVFSMNIHSNYCSPNNSGENETMQQANDLERYRQLRDLLVRRPSIALVLQQKEMEQQDNPCTSFEPKYYQPDYCKECSKHQSVHFNSKYQVSTAVHTSNEVYQENQQKARSLTITSVDDLKNSTGHQETCKQQLGLSKTFESRSDSDLTKLARPTAVKVGKSNNVEKKSNGPYTSG
ncbi:unnamed protein product [Didymodactylos carnosus]|uniref:Uncharacterized protein n=1 Tax=Didymodactylos carnosus TaxID=1234261 RepID=A0A8S2EZR2_9BILA|nr:unnamed protein product [Didymodactylos carnosus]CAF4091987.1 unnamed protein product [Didymodactylos carnosus]